MYSPLPCPILKDCPCNEKSGNFGFYWKLFTSPELQRIQTIASQLGYLVCPDAFHPHQIWRISGLGIRNKADIEAFFELAKVEI